MNFKFKNQIKRTIKLILFTASPAKQKWFHDFHFDIMTPLPKSAALKLKSVLDRLQNEIKYFRISDGTLLGLFRDGKLISHDNDFDFDVEFNSRNIQKIYQLAHEKAWTLGRHVKYHGRTQQLTFYDEERVIFDFIFWQTDSMFAINFSEPSRFRIMPQSYLLNLKSHYFEQIETVVNIPAEVESWAKYRYGTSWNIPETRKGDWTETCGDLGYAWWLD